MCMCALNNFQNKPAIGTVVHFMDKYWYVHQLK